MMTKLTRKLIVLSCIPGLGSAALRKIAAKILEGNVQQEELLTRDQNCYLDENEAGIAELVDRLVEEDIEVLNYFEDSYPPRIKETLKDKSPVLLYARGNLALLRLPAIGISGSRQVSEAGLRFTRACAEEVSRQGVVVVSGHAIGVDQAAEQAIIESGGSVIVVYAMGLFRTNLGESASTTSDMSRALVLSEFHPMMTWNVGNAMQRNKTICGLSDALIIIEPGTQGGTCEAGRSCLKLGVPLLIGEYPDLPEGENGIAELVRKGGEQMSQEVIAERIRTRRLAKSLESVTPQTMDLFL